MSVTFSITRRQILRSYTTLAYLLALFLFTPTLTMAQPANETLEPIEVSAMVLDNRVPALFFKGESDEYQPFDIGRNKVGNNNILPPLTKALVLYTEQKSEGITQMVSLMSIPLPTNATRFYLIFNRNSQGGMSHQLIKDSADIHPGGTIRLVNTTKIDVAFLLNGDVHPLKGDSEEVLPIKTKDDLFTFSYAMDYSGDYRRMIPTKMLRLSGPNARIMMILTYRKYFSDEGSTQIEWRPHLTQVFTKVPESKS